MPVRSTDGEEAGRRLAALRAQHDLTQQAAASALGVGYRTYQAWEAGDSTPRRAGREALAALFGGEPADYLGVPVASQDRLDALEQRQHELEERVDILERAQGSDPGHPG